MINEQFKHRRADLGRTHGHEIEAARGSVERLLLQSNSRPLRFNGQESECRERTDAQERPTYLDHLRSLHGESLFFSGGKAEEPSGTIFGTGRHHVEPHGTMRG